MKIIFLDFDGVLNSQKFFSETVEERAHSFNDDELSHWVKMIDPEAVKVLNTIIEKSGAKIVVSSTWRIINTLTRLREILVIKGFKFPETLIAKTPNHVEPGMRHRRGNHIQMWLNNRTDVEKFVIIDDDSDMEHLMHKLVQTRNEEGLLEKHVEPILGHLA